MNRIRVLPEHVKNKIAAGEVIEGPFSVVKELMENAIDAGATRIDVQVSESGLKKISVRDNGYGMYRDDIPLALTEHATSKIQDIHDIENISSYGFRGEALSSIASISRITILSRSDDEEIGSRLSGSDSEINVRDYAGPAGTTVTVEELFYNIPARKRFLKSERSEMRAIREIFLKLALPNPGITFSLEPEGKRRLTLGAVDTIDERIVQVYGKSAAEGLIHESIRDLRVSLTGFLSGPDFLKSSRSMQALYVNSRPVEYRYLGFLLSRAYEAVALRGQHPAGIIFIDIEPGLVDVNIHPAKREVKLFDQKYLDSMIIHLAEKVLNRRHVLSADRFTDVEQGREGAEGIENHLQPPGNSGLFPENDLPERPADQGPLPCAGEIVRESADLYAAAGVSSQRVLGVAFGTYILVEENDTLVIIDFHAAHERLIFDRIMERKGDFETQELMFPVVMDLALEEHRLLLDYIEDFREIGFDIEDFADNSVIVRAVPEVAGSTKPEQILREFLDSGTEGDSEIPDVRSRISAAVACHTALRAGDSISDRDMHELVQAALGGSHVLRCPHGRPYVFTMKKNDIERMFKRQ